MLILLAIREKGYVVSIPWINIWFIDGIKNLIFKVWHVKVTFSGKPISKNF